MYFLCDDGSALGTMQVYRKTCPETHSLLLADFESGQQGCVGHVIYSI